MVNNVYLMKISVMPFLFARFTCRPTGTTVEVEEIEKSFNVSVKSYEFYSEFRCTNLKVHECRWYCEHIGADEAECEDPWPPSDSLNCFCYKNYILIVGKVLHLNLTEDLYLDPEKLAMALS